VGVQAMATSFLDARKEGKDLKDVLAKFNDVTGDSARFQKDMGRYLDTTGGKLEVFKAKLMDIFDETMMDNINDLAGYLPEFTNLLKFIADNKVAILAFWASQKLGGGALGGAGLGGGAAGAAGVAGAGAAVTAGKAGGGLPARVPRAAPTAPTAPAAGIGEGVGIGIISSELGKGIQEQNKTLAQALAAREKTLGREMSMGEKIKYMLQGLEPHLGTGPQWKAPEQKVREQIELSQATLKLLEKAVRDGASKAKPQVFIPSPLKDSGGTTPTPLHGG
jgi:hypothetical protein